MNALTHTCHAIGCTTPCKPQLLMCLPHWKKVPGLVQPLVYAFYRKGQCDTKQPSAEWTAAAMCAVVMVALRSKLTRQEFLAGLKGWVLSLAAHFDRGEETEPPFVRNPNCPCDGCTGEMGLHCGGPCDHHVAPRIRT